MRSFLVRHISSKKKKGNGSSVDRRESLHNLVCEVNKCDLFAQLHVLANQLSSDLL